MLPDPAGVMPQRPPYFLTRQRKANLVTEYFVMFGLAWWILISASSLIIMFAVRERNGGLASFIAALTLVIWVLVGDLLMQVKQKEFGWGATLAFVAAYILIGIGYMLVAWWRRNAQKSDYYEDFKNTWLSSRGILDGVVPENLKTEWSNAVKAHSLERTKYRWGDEWKRWWTREIITDQGKTQIIDLNMYPSEHKSEISMWITLWPWSAVEFFAFDFLITLTNRIRRSFEGTLLKISRWTFKNTDSDFVPQQLPAPTADR